jgi:hypothetical protein
MDRGSECVRDNICGVTLKTTSTNECVPELERHIRVVEERGRTIRITLPLKKLLNRMII